MRSRPLEQFVMLIAFVVAFLCFVIQLLQGASLVYAAFVACCVVLATAIVCLFLLRVLGGMMARYMREMKRAEDSDSASPQLSGETESGSEDK